MLLISGLVAAAGTYVEDQREQVIRSELQVIGEQVSADLAAIDRLAQTWGTESVVVSRELPERVAGNTYVLEVIDAGTGDPHLELRTTNPDVTVKVDLGVKTEILPGSAGGGDVELLYNGAELEVEDV